MSTFLLHLPVYRWLTGPLSPVALLCYASGLLALMPATAQTMLFDGSRPGLLRPDPFNRQPNALWLDNDPAGNQLTLSATGKGQALSNLYGALSTDPGAAATVANHQLSMNGGQVLGVVYGGYAHQGQANGNTVTQNGGENGGVTGGYGTQVTANRVLIRHGRVQGHVYGAFGTHDAATPGRVVGANQVHIGGGTVSGNGFAGYSFDPVSLAQGNHMLVTGGEVGTPGAGNVLEGGHSQGTGNADQNVLTIQGGTIHSLIRTGHALESGSASGNITNLSGGQINNDVYSGNAAGGGRTDHNVINLSGGNIRGTLYGGSNPDSVGNTLNLIGYQGQVSSVQNMQHYNFILPASVQDGDVILGIAGDAVDLQGTQIAVTGIEGGGALLEPGAMVTLLDRTVNREDALRTPVVKKGAGVEYSFQRVDDPGQLQIRLQAVKVAPQTTSLLDAEVAGMALLNQGGDRVAALSGDLGRYIKGTQLFGDLSGSRSRYKDANVKLNGQIAVAGGASLETGANGSRLFGAFVEYGTANFNTDAPSANGAGKSHYTGVGAFGRYQHGNGLSLTGALRIGRAHLNYRNSGLCTLNGRCAQFSLSVPYYSLQAGLGWARALSTRTRLDLYSRLVWTHLDGSTQTVAGDPYQFDAFDSYRWRHGLRLNLAVNRQWQTFAGLAFEQEYAGQATGKVYQLGLATQSIRGATGIAEGGVRWRQAKAQGKTLQLDAALEGYSGIRRGVGGQLRVHYAF